MRQKLNTLLITFLVITASSLPASAQDYNSSVYQYKPFSLGITLSPNMSWMRYGDSENHESSAKLGFAYGLLADFGFSDNYYFSTGLLINTLNNKSTYPNPISSVPNTIVSADYRIQYAEIPLALKLKSTQRYFRSYYGLFGFTTGFKLNSKEREEGASSRRSLGSEANFLRLALQIGGGAEWQLDHNLTLMTGLTFNNGFTRAVKQGDPRNSYVSFNFGIFF